MTTSELAVALAARGLIGEGESLGLGPARPQKSPWYVQVVLAISAWFAGLFLLGFLFLGLEDTFFHGHDNWPVVLVLAGIMCGGASILYGVCSETSTFGPQFALAMSCAGQFGLTMAFGSLGNVRTAIWGMLVVEIVLILAMRNRLQRFLLALGAIIAWALGTHDLLFRDLPGISWGTPESGPYQISPLSVILWVAAWAPVAYAAYWFAAREPQWMADGREALMRPVTHGLIAALSIAPLATHPATFWSALGMGSTHLLTDGSLNATALWPLLSVIPAEWAMALAFRLRNRPLIGLAILFGLVEVSAFYYVLGVTLLVKSIIMIVIGAALLASSRVMAVEVMQ